MMSNRQTIILDEVWGVIKEGIVKLWTMLEDQPGSSFTSKEYMTLYTHIYNLCTKKPPPYNEPEVYNRYRETIVEYINLMVLPYLREKHNAFLLREFVRRWTNHKLMVGSLSHLFNYLDRYYILRRSLPGLEEVGQRCFHNLVFNEMKGRVKDVVLVLIKQEREGEQVDRALLKNVLDIFREVSGYGNMALYEEDFESHMLEDTTSYYSWKASSHIVMDSLPDYLLMAEECSKRERERASHYLHASSEEKLLEKTQHALLLQHAHVLLEKEQPGLRKLLQDGEVGGLRRIYRLFSAVSGGLKTVAQALRKHVEEDCSTLVKEAEDVTRNEKVENKDAIGLLQQGFVRKVVELHHKYLGYVNNCFMSHSLFHMVLAEAFYEPCNKGVAGISAPELLATFCDNILKKGGGNEKLSYDAIEETLEKIVKLLEYVHDKDFFDMFYRKKLARRLLFNQSANDDHERSILTKMKQCCGTQFTSKMEGMVMDLTLAREDQQIFNNYLEENPHENTGIRMTVTVLTSGFWPSYKSSDLNLPTEMARNISIFKKFYETKTKHRKLTWIFSWGTCNVIGRFKSKPIELKVTTYQAAMLLLFNDSEKLSYQEIISQLNLAYDDVTRLLNSLSCMKHKILNKEPNNRTISSSDTFEFNSMFTDKMRRIQIPLPPVDEKKLIEDVDRNRRYTIDTSLVRIMKSRKVLGYQQLVTECAKQLDHLFKPDLKAIKKRIEDLIERDYLERDKDNARMLNYVA